MNWLVDADVTEPLIVSQVQASGGTETVITVGGKLYRVHTFTSNGTFVVTNGGEIEMLLVGGGGGGGKLVGAPSALFQYFGGGGGGAGGFLQVKRSVTSSSSYPIQVGSGGDGANGGDSSIFFETGDEIIAQGGGYGGEIDMATFTADGLDGGSSGGGGMWAIANASGDAGNRVFGQGNSGADAFSTSLPGGGGGASEPAVNPNNIAAPNGGNGKISGITGNPVYYAGGGGGGVGIFANQKSFGGIGGGGNGADFSDVFHAGATSVVDATDGENGKGGGGGGMSAIVFETNLYEGSAGKGGSGIVIIRYPIEG